LKFEGSIQTKNEIIDALIWFINNNTEYKKQALLNLSEFIEDCQFDQIKTKILDILGKEGSSLKNPSILIRHIYNRIILENPIVRAAAISSLAEIANREPKVRKNVVILLKK
jgi:coatomer protein complex subunit gamma